VRAFPSLLPLALLATGCVTTKIVDEVQPAAWSWATCDKLEVTFIPPEASTNVRLVGRTEGDTAAVGTGTRAYAHAVGTAQREAMITEALEGPLRSTGDVIACYELEPPLRFPDAPWEATALMVVESDDGPVVLVRGPFGWSRASVQNYERCEPSAGKEIAAASGIGVLLVLGLTTDAILGTLLVSGVVLLLWIMAGLPGLCWAISQKHKR
jgi:hypothetical protein